jgi:hypothetical protein
MDTEMTLQNSVPSSKSRSLTSPRRRRVRRSPIKHRAKGTTYMRNRPTDESTKPIQYVKGLSARERVDMVLQELDRKHRWSIKDLVYYMVTAKPIKKYGMSCLARAKALSDGIYQQEEVVEQLAHASQDIRTVGNSVLVGRIRAELRSLSKPDIGLGEFDPGTDIAKLDIPALAERVQKVAPELWQLLGALMEPQDARSHRDTFAEYQGSIVMICSILAHARAPKTSNNLPMLLGLYLHSMGVKRRTINVLAGLGITSSYWSVNARRGELADIGKVPPLLRINPPLLPSVLPIANTIIEMDHTPSASTP